MAAQLPTTMPRLISRRAGQPARLLLAGGVSFALAGGVPTGSLAEDFWYNQPRISVGALYNDNIGLTTDDARSSFGANVAASILAGRRTETTDLSVSGAVGGTTYFDSPDDDSVNAGLSFNAARNWDRNRFGLAGSFSYLPTTTSEVATTGDLRSDSTRLLWSLTPFWLHRLSERADIELAATYSEATYQGSSTDLDDYQNLGGWLLGSYALTEVTQGTMRLSFDRYESRGVEESSDSVGLTAGVRHRFTERLSGAAELGVRYSQTEREILGGLATIDDSSTGPLANFTIDWQRETGALSFQFGRWLTPSGDGLLDTTRLTVSASEQLSERLAINGGLQAYRNRGEELTTLRRNGDRDYASASLGFSYRLTEWWQLQGTYSYRWQEYEDDDAATGNTVYLNVSYTWPRELPGLYSGP
jgi:hypothetical protein